MARVLLTLLTMAAMMWCAALVWFLHVIPLEPAPPSLQTDAIIVLTGGQERVEHGLEMVADGAAPVLFISGVGQHVTLTQMLAKHASAHVQQNILERQPEIVFDYVADSTRSNADQAAEFIRKRGIRSIRLVTAHYHMPRSKLEFEISMPDITIIPDPVFPEGFRRDEWWKHDNTRRLVFSEFYKYFAAWFRSLTGIDATRNSSPTTV